jgi:hypothetical protein
LPPRKPKAEPTIDYHLSSAFKDDDIISLILKGHLVIEAMAAKILEHIGFGDEIWRWSFPKKIDECVANSPMPQWIGNICLDINEIRNDYCHSLGHQTTFDEIFEYVQKWSESGLEYTDETIYSDKVYSEECYGLEGILTETLSNTMFEINEVFSALGIKETYLA